MSERVTEAKTRETTYVISRAAYNLQEPSCRCRLSISLLLVLLCGVVVAPTWHEDVAA